jgi:hypothetical protein
MNVTKPDLSEFAAEPPGWSGTQCWYDRLTPEQQSKSDAAHDAGYNARVIASVVTKWGMPIKENAIRRHYRAHTVR